MTWGPYASILYSDCLTAEEEAPYQTIRERHMQALWLEQKYLRPLRLHDGTDVEVVSPGSWNTDAGPDFVNAHIRIGDTEFFGDVELHLNQEGWTQHRHHIDPRYNRVILHVALWSPREVHPIEKEDGSLAPTLILQDLLTIPVKRLLRLLDLDLYPYRRFTPAGRCSRSVFARLPDGGTHELLRGAAFWRLREKARSLKAWVESPRLYAGAGVALALGYSKNAQRFLELFLTLYPLRLDGPAEYTALAMACCGFFGDTFKEKWGKSPFYIELERLWKALGSPLPLKAPLELGQQRPANHPLRRLVALSYLLTSPDLEQLTLRISQCWAENYKQDPRILRRTLHGLLSIPKDPYWSTHYLFEEEAQAKEISLIGASTKDVILVNCFLPLIYEEVESRHQLDELRYFEALYSSLPAVGSRKQRYLEHRFFDNKETLPQAILQQGAFQLHRDFCMHYEASCAGCPFDQRLMESVKQCASSCV